VASYLLFLRAVTVVGLALQLGMASPILRFVPLLRGEDGERGTGTLRRRVFAVQLAVWAIVLPPLVLLWPATSWRLGVPELGGAAAAIAGMGALASLSRLFGAYLRAFRRYAAAVLEQLLPRALIAAGLLVLYALGERVSWATLAALFSAAMIACALAQAAALATTTAAETRGTRAARSAPSVAGIARMATIVGAHGLAAALLVSADLWVLSMARTHREVAVYGMMLSLLQLVTIGSLAAQFVVPQEFSHLHAEGRHAELQHLARQSATATLLFATVAALALALAGRPLISVLLGPQYVAGWGMLLVLAVGRLWDAASGPAGSLLLMTGHHVRVTVTTLACTALSVALALALAPRWGGYGVAAASSLGLIAVNVVNVRAARRLLGVVSMAHPSPAAYGHVLRRLRAVGRRP
jgi:O-antigen/teichoic acid export membrane protein